MPFVDKMLEKKNHPATGFYSILMLLALFLFLAVLLSAFRTESATKNVSEVIKKEVLHDLNELIASAQVIKKSLESYEQEQSRLSRLQEDFYQLKKAYKEVEYFIEYLDPELAKSLNGAPIPKVVVEHQPYLTLLNKEEPVFTSFPAEGLQVLEETIFAQNQNPQMAEEALRLVYRLEEKTNLFRNSLYNQFFTNRQILESLREQLVRVMTMGVTGFDTPAAEQNLEMAAISLEPVLEALRLYREAETAAGLLEEKLETSHQLVGSAIEYLLQNNDFDSFNRMYFIRELADPAYGSLTGLQPLLLQTERPSPDLAIAVNDQARSLFDEGFLQATYYAKQDHSNSNPELIKLGKLLFFDPALSANNKRSCASCHVPSKGFTDERAKSLTFDFKGSTLRNSPTLLNSVFSTAYFWDSRVQYLQDQIPDVLTNEDELHGTYEEVVEKLEGSREYRRLFNKAFKEEGGKSLNINTINRAIAAYVQSLVALDSPFDKYMRKETEEFSQPAIRGFNLFAGKAACATCHFAPVFNGTVPPRYQESETEVLGVTATTDFLHPTLDADSGRAGVIKAEAFVRSFKTPTVRNAALTAPYMHNGAFATLEEVVEFYDVGGGAGLGLEVPNQTLPATPLNLTAEEKQDLVSFLESLTDTTGTTSIPERLPSFPGKSALNKRKVGGEY